MNNGFQFKHFFVRHDRCAMKVGTDGVLLGALAEGGPRILDIGTGTALCALMMAQRYPHATVTGIDIDRDACLQAHDNVAASPFRDRITIIHSPLDDYAAGDIPPFDAIISNPPFFEDSLECPDSDRNAARHTSSLPYSVLLSVSARLLSDTGTLTLIIPTQSVRRIEEECAYSHLFITRRLHIQTTERKEPKRTILYIRKRAQAPHTETHVLMHNGTRSPWFATITQDFYL